MRGWLPFLRTACCGLLLFAIGVGPSAAQSNMKEADPKAKETDPKTTPAIKLPSGAIIVVTSDPDAIDKSASVYLTPERYKELNDQIEQLKKQIAAERPSPPSVCELDGRVEMRASQNVVRLRATFKYRTTQSRSVIHLGCQKMQAVDAKADNGKLPLLASTEKGLSVLVEEAGEHTLRLELEAALTARGTTSAEVGFEVGLPGAAITLLSFATPAKVQRVTISRRELLTPPLLGAAFVEGPLEVKRIDAAAIQPGNSEALGAITYLGLSWEDETRAVASTATRSAEADVQVTVSDTEITSEARLRLKGAAREWRFAAPSNSEVSIGRPPTVATGKPLDFPLDQIPDLLRPEPGQLIWRIRFRETNALDIQVMITARTPRAKVEPKSKSGLNPIGPFAVFDVPAQTGTIRVKASPHIRVTPTLRGDTQRIDTGQDPAADMYFRYRTQPTGPNNQPVAPLELDVRPATGVVQTHLHHYVKWSAGGWNVQTEIAVSPIRAEIDTLELEVPSAVVFEAMTPKLVEGIGPVRDSGPQRRVVQLKLAATQRADFSVRLDGTYPYPSGAQQTTLLLPRILNAFDRNGQVTVSIPDGFDVTGSAIPFEAEKSAARPTPLETTTGPDKSPALGASVSRTLGSLDVSWKAQRADIRVEAQIDITLGDSQARVSHSMKCTFADRVPKRLRVHATAPVIGIAANPGNLELHSPIDWSIALASETGKEATIVFTYAFPLPSNSEEQAAPLTVPMLWPDGVNWCESRVRIWRDRQSQRAIVPIAEGNIWEESAPDLLANQASLPQLVLHATGVNLPLVLKLTSADGSDSAGTLTNVWVDRALIQAQMSGSFQQYRARFHLRRWTARTMDLEFPAEGIGFEFIVNSVKEDAREGRSNSETGRLFQVRLPAWREGARGMVEVRYQLPARNEGFGSVVSVWQPPRTAARTTIGSIRWQVALPANTAPLSLGSSVFEERWTLRNGLAQPLPAHSTAELEKWLADGSVATGWEMGEAGVVARQNALAPLRVASVPRPVLIAGISLIVFIFGLLLARLPKRAVGVLLSLGTAGAIVIGFLWPQPSGQILAASQPGLALLVIVLALQRLLQWNYRRRLARLPGFTRIRAESALTRSNGQHVGRETSTVDTPGALSR